MSLNYTVNHHSSIDCYKRAETSTYTVYSGTDELVAYGHAVDKWLELWSNQVEYIEPSELEIDSRLLELLTTAKEASTVENLKSLHEYFSSIAYTFWEPEYINCPIEEVTISTTDAEEVSNVVGSINTVLERLNSAVEAQK